MTNFISQLDKSFVMFHYYNCNDKYETREYLDQKKEIYNDIVKCNIGKELTRGVIDKDYIKNTMKHKNIEGLFFKNKYSGEYAGFIMFMRRIDCIKLILIGASQDKEVRDYQNMGTLMIQCLEKMALDDDYDYLKSKVVIEAIDFYVKNGWKIISENKKKGMFKVIKILEEDEDGDYMMMNM